jgi:nitrate reductase NapE component
MPTHAKPARPTERQEILLFLAFATVMWWYLFVAVAS